MGLLRRLELNPGTQEGGAAAGARQCSTHRHPPPGLAPSRGQPHPEVGSIPALSKPQLQQLRKGEVGLSIPRALPGKAFSSPRLLPAEPCSPARPHPARGDAAGRQQLLRRAVLGGHTVHQEEKQERTVFQRRNGFVPPGRRPGLISDKSTAPTSGSGDARGCPAGSCSLALGAMGWGGITFS